MRLPVFIFLAIAGMILFSCIDEPEEVKSVDLVALDSTRITVTKYLQRNNITEYEITDSGLVYIVDEPGSGDFPKNGQTVTVHYSGYHLEDDSKFDSSYDRNEAFSFILGEGEVISGWDEGIAFFKKGGKGTLFVPYHLAYGVYGNRGAIGPLEDLKFDVNLIAID